MHREGIDIIKASAGSGKTYTLARTYIANLIGIPTGNYTMIGGKQVDCFKLRSVLDYHRHILAITFTNKATNEMKERIVLQLFQLGKGEGDYINDFKLMFQQNSIEEVSQAARRALSAILFDYGSFNVSTIDSFFQNILRNFAREVDRDYNYDLELDEDYATSVAIHDFLMDLGGDNVNQKAVDNWVREFIENNITNKKSWNFFGKSSSDRLKKFASIIYKEFFREHHEQIVKYLSDIGTGSGKSRVLRFRQQLIARRKLRQKSYEDAQLAVKEFFVKCGLTVDNIKTKSPARTILEGDLSAFENSKDTLRKYSQEDDALRKNVLYKQFNAMVNDDQSLEFKSLLVSAFEHSDMIDFLNSVIDNIWNLGLLGKIDEKLEQYRKDTNSIMIADTNELIGKVLDCGATFIYEHAGTMFNNYMIDEFQDTSRKQYDNFTPLLEESIARGNVNLIIGDEKQSIYRFRNSDPAMLREEIEKAFDTKSITLDTNYRSFLAIVNFNNSFFESVIDYYRREHSEFESLGKTYKNIVQQPFKDKHEGFVNINVVPYSGRSDKEEREKILQCLPIYINKLRERGYAMSDIAVLVNKRKEGNAVVESILEYNDALGSDNHPNHIDVISAESLLLKNSPSVRLIISVLRFLEITQYELDPENDDTAGENNDFKYFLKKRVAEQRHYKILHDFESRIQSVPAKVDTGDILLSCFEDDKKMDDGMNAAQRLNLYSTIAAEVMPDSTMQLTNLVNIVDLIIDKYILNSATSGDVKIENSFLLSFMNVVLDFSRQHNGGTVKEFLLFWDEKKDKLAVSSPSDANAVNVMTIHKSKGLEFKCVIIPFACWDLVTPDKVFWVKKADWLNPSPIEDIGLNNEDIIPPLIPVAPNALRTASLFTKLLDDEDEKSLIDNLNKLYVALTRPKEELHVFTIIKKKEFEDQVLKVEELNNSAHLLLSFVTNWGVGKMNFTSGMDYLPCDIESEQIDLLSQDEHPKMLEVYSYKFGNPIMASSNGNITSNDDNHRTMPGYFVSPVKMPVRVSLTDAGASMKEEGVRMHQLFSLINSHADFNYALSYGEANGLFQGNKYWTRDQLKKVFSVIDGDDVLSSWFVTENTVYNERVISFPRAQDGDDQEHRRPDRIIRRPDGEIIVVDYKFGFKTDDTTIQAHKNKVAEYMTLLQQLGYSKITGYIWYLRTNKIVTVE